jgi:mono/diheme cytochrome c family protein
MRFLRDALITIVLLGVVALVLVVVMVRHGGLNATEEPGRLERAAAGRLMRLSIPSDVDRQKSPFANDANAWHDAKDHYMDHCAVCHGQNGKGDTDAGKNMYPRVPDLTAAATQAKSDGALFYIIQNGVRWTGMPAWKGEHSPDESWKLVAFIRKLPTLTEADLQNHDRDHDHEDAASDDKPAPHHQHKPGHEHRR